MPSVWFASSVIALMASCAAIACIETPHFSSAVEGAGGAPSGVGAAGARDGMVLVPGVTLDGVSPAGVDPSGPGNGKDKGDKEDEEKEDKPGKGPGPGPGGTDAGAASPAEPPSPTPAGAIAVPAFWIDVREVTAAAYRDCLDVNACTAPAAGPGCTLSEGALSNPVTCVTIEQARAFCTWSKKRLVRSDEWTAAAAGVAQRLYPWGSEPPAADRLNACGSECSPAGMYAASDGHVGSAPGGSHPLGRTPEGVEDLGGNVAEWVDSTLVSFVRGASFADSDPAFAGSTHQRVAAATEPSVGFRCAADH